MSRTGQRVLSMLLWSWGGTVYFLLEVAFKTATGTPERISWTMLVIAMLLTVPVERCGEQLPWEVPLLIQSLVCALLVTATEFISGLVLNIWLGLGIWDYSHLWGNILGQICPQFFLVWWGLCFVFIPAFDWLRWSVQGGRRPSYKLISF
jgi:hypothetical protein